MEHVQVENKIAPIRTSKQVVTLEIPGSMKMDDDENALLL
jgi:hypothetical protein